MVSCKVKEFCKAHSLDDRRAYHMALAVEEMAGNVIEHGFSKDNRKHSLDVRVIKKSDGYILRIRDDCYMLEYHRGIPACGRMDACDRHGPVHGTKERDQSGSFGALRVQCMDGSRRDL